MKSHRSIDAPRADVSAAITPDWRHAKAIEIISRPRSMQPDGRRGRYATAKRLDGLTLRYVQFLRQVDSYTSDRGLKNVAKDHPDLFMAEKVSQEATLRPLEIRARALAGQSDRAISRAVGLPIPAVAAFLGLFFDIRPRLEAKSWIRWTAIGIRLDQPPAVESILLWHCWKRGVTVIEPWLDYVQHQAENHDLNSEIGRQRAAIDLLVQMRQLPDEPEIRSSLLKKFAYTTRKLPEIPKSASVAGVFSQNEAEILQEIAWKRSQPADQTEVATDCNIRCSPWKESVSPKDEVYGKAG